MNNIDDKDLSLNKSIKFWDNIPLDSRFITASLNELDDYIHYPYIGMIFYSIFEDDYYKVTSLESGYRINRLGTIVRASELDEPSTNVEIPKYFVGTYEQYVLKGNTNTMIKKAYIDVSGYLHIVFNDDRDTNVGYVRGDSGYCPQIKENENNNITNLEDLLYKLDIKYCDEITHLQKEFTTPNLIGPYVVNIKEELDDNGNKTGYIIFILNTGDTYRIGPTGIKKVELVPEADNYKLDLVITFNDNTILNLGNIRGDKGTSIHIIGTLNNTNELPHYATNGDSYIINKNLYFYWNGAWNDVGQIVGDDGKTPNISIKTKRIYPETEDNDQRTKIKIEFYNDTTLINDPFYIYEAFSPEIKIASFTDKEYKLVIAYADSNGNINYLYTPNLKGKDGNSINIKGSISVKTDLTQYYPNAEKGDSYIVDNEDNSNDGHLWVFTGEDGNDEKHFNGFLDVGKIKGPQGEQGTKGDNGDDGNSIKLKIEDKMLKYCYIDKNGKEISSYIDLIELSEITGPQGISPIITIIENNNEVKLKIVDKDGEKITPNLKGSSGENGISLEMRYANNFIQYRRYIEKDGNKVYPDTTKDNWINLAFIPTITQKTIEGGVELTIGDATYIIKSAKNIKMRYRPSQGENDPGYIQWQLEGDSYWNNLISIDKLFGKSMSVGTVTTGTVPNGNNAEVNIIKNTSKSDDYNNVYDFSFTIPEGMQGNDGKGITKVTSEYNGNNELIIYFTITNPKTGLEEIKTINVGNIKGEKGEQGEDGNSITNMELKSYDSESDTIIFTITFDKIPSKDISITGLKGKKGDTGIGIASVNQTTTTKDSSGENIVTVTLTDGKTSTIKIYNGAKGEDGTSVNIKGTLESTDLLPTKDVDKGDGWLIDGYLWVYTGSTEDGSVNGFTNVGKIQGPQGKGITDVKGNYNSENILESLVFTITDPATDKSIKTNPILVGDIKGSDGKEIELRKSETTIQWRYVGEDVWKDLITLESITGPQGEKGDKGEDGSNGINGKEIELRKSETTIQWRYVGTEEWNDLITLESITGPQGEPGANGTDGKDGVNGKSAYEIAKEKGFDGSETEWLESLKGKDGTDGKNTSVSIIENENNTNDIYKLDISYANGDVITNFTTPNLKGDSAKLELYKILDTLPDTNTEELNLDTNHIYMILKDGKEIVSKEANYDKYIILNIAEDNTITWEKIETTEASGNILVICEELPDISTASTNFIYCLLTPEYERGLNIGLTNDTSANKNHYEEWIVIIDSEGNKHWELLGPQMYRISEAMIDYIWNIKKEYTVYDDWDDTTDISDYQKDFGDITPLSNFVYRIEGSNLILVKYIGSGDIYLNIAPKYKIGDKVYNVTEIDGTYYPEKEYHYINSEGKVTDYIFDTSKFQYDKNGVEITQTLLTGPQVYSLYIADSITKITRVLINTSNIPRYHIPYSLKSIGDYAFYSSANQTMVFEKLNADGKTVTYVGLEDSTIESIGEYGCACTPNMRMCKVNTDGSLSTTNYITTPSTLKKISNYGFYSAGQVAHVDTRKSSNLYIGNCAFARSNLSAVQYLSSSTYYTDSSFLGYENLYHDNKRVVGGGGMYFYSQDTIGYNFNDIAHTEASETAVLNVTLTSNDPTFNE